MAHQVIWRIEGKAETVAELERSLAGLGAEIGRTPGFVRSRFFQRREEPAQFCWLTEWGRRAEGEAASFRAADGLVEIAEFLVEPATRCTLEFLWEYGVQPGIVETTEMVRLVMAQEAVEPSLAALRQAAQSIVGRFGIVSLSVNRCVERPVHLYVVQELERRDAADELMGAPERRQWLGEVCDALVDPPHRYRLKSPGWPNSATRV